MGNGTILDVQSFYQSHPLPLMMRSLTGGAFDRGLPEDDQLAGDPSVVNFFRHLLNADGGIEVPASRQHENEAIVTCHQHGWIHADIDRSGITPMIRYMFASPLHKACLSWKLEPINHGLEFQSLLDMSRSVISRFKSANLKAPRRVGCNMPVEGSEAVYRLEFSRSSTS